jgi:hypothetical protein
MPLTSNTKLVPDGITICPEVSVKASFRVTTTLEGVADESAGTIAGVARMPVVIEPEAATR